MEAAAAVLHPAAAELAAERRTAERRVAWLFVGTGLLLFAAMGLAGLAMRLDQAEVYSLPPSWFYRLMTLHGAGMLTGALLATMGALWFVLRSTVPLDVGRMVFSFVAILAGAVGVVVAVLVGGFATGWTFLWPLPFSAAGAWREWATVVFLIGLLLVGVGFLVYLLDLLIQTTRVFGGLQRSLGVSFLRGRDDSPPPPQAIAAVVVALEGLLASAVGTTMILALLGRAIDRGAELDALWAKNLTYFFGHSLANLIIYLAAGAVYAFLPLYAGRPWRTTKPIVVGWLFTLLFVATAYSHHLYMDFVQPGGLQVMSTFASFGAALPAAVVTIFTGMMLVWGSRYRWTLASALLYLGFAGWAIGGTGAVLDSVIPFNFRFHNTLWVPAHFHTYLLMCVILWALAFFTHLLEQAAGRTAGRGWSVVALAGLLVGGYGLVGAWYVSGALGVPRRYAVQPPGSAGYSLAGSVFAMIFALGFLVLLAELAKLALAARRRARFVEVERASTWTGGRYPTLRRRERQPADEPPLPEAAEPPRPPLTTPAQVAAALAAAIVALAAFFPAVTHAAEDSVRYHHLAHAGQFLFGALVGVVLASLPHVFGRLAGRTWFGILAVVAAPSAMLMIMLPEVYGSLEGNPGLHFLYHVGVAALGVVTGLGAAALGLVAGRLAFVLSIGMAAMYAAGVTGG